METGFEDQVVGTHLFVSDFTNKEQGIVGREGSHLVIGEMPGQSSRSVYTSARSSESPLRLPSTIGST